MAVVYSDKFASVVDSINDKATNLKSKFVDKSVDSMNYVERQSALSRALQARGGSIEFDGSKYRVNSAGVPMKDGKFVSNQDTGNILKSLNNLFDKQEPIEKMVATIRDFVSNMNDTLEAILEVNIGIRDEMQTFRQMFIENQEDIDRNRRLTPPSSQEPPEPIRETSITPLMEEVSLPKLITAAMIAPFAYQFIKGFLTEITDGLLEVTPTGVSGAIAAARPIMAGLGKAITGSVALVRGLFSPITAGIVKLGGAIKAISTPVSGLVKYLSFITRGASAFLTSISNAVKSIAPILTKLSGIGVLNVVSKIAWPITVFLSLYDGIKAFMAEEGNIIEKTLSGLGGIVKSLIGAPLDFIKSGVAYIISKFGWDSGAEFLRSFSFSTIITDMFSGLYSWIESAGKWVKSLFVWDEPKESNESSFFSTFVDDAMVRLKEIFNAMFESFPSLEEIKDMFVAIIPEKVRWVFGLDQPEVETEVSPIKRTPVVGNLMEFEKELKKAEERYESAPEGPQKEAAKRSLDAMKQTFERIKQSEKEILVEPKTQGSIPSSGAKTEMMNESSMTLKNKTQSVFVRGGDNLRGGDTINNGGNSVVNITTVTDPSKSLRSSPK